MSSGYAQDLRDDAGGSNGSGGFGYSRVATPKIRACGEAIIYEFYTLPMAKYLLPNKPVDEEILARILRDPRLNYNGETKRPNLEGDLEPLFMDFGIDPVTNRPYIEALRPMFDLLMTKSIKVEDVKRMLIHEALHTFGYSEVEAFNASTAIVKATREFHRNRALWALNPSKMKPAPRPTYSELLLSLPRPAYNCIYGFPE